MSDFTVVQLLGKFLANYHIGHAVFLLFLLTIPVGVVKRSMKLTAIVLVAFGGLFVVVPSISDAEPIFSFFGIFLLVVGPMAYVNASR